MKNLFLIPARGGSKGVPGKNIKPLGGRPLIYYTLDAATRIADPEQICVSTDSDEIMDAVIQYGLGVPFRRPEHLATDMASSYEVMLHAIEFYEKMHMDFDCIVLLQPTSPFRREDHIQKALDLYTEDLDMVVSVKNAKSNPYFTLFEENAEGFLEPSKKSFFSRRQDCPPVYEYNGAIYVMNTKSLKKGPIQHFTRIKKYLMPQIESLDIDTELDFRIAEMVMEKGLHRQNEAYPVREAR